MAGFYTSTETDAYTNNMLRGGPTMIVPAGFSTRLFVESNSRKKLVAEASGFYYKGYEESGQRYGVDFELSYKPISNLSLSLEPEFSYRQSELQYIDQQHFDPAERYIFGSIDQKTFSASIRIDLILTPEMTLQYWGQPFIASGDYSQFKYITDPKAASFEDRYHIYGDEEITYFEEEDYYSISETESGLNYEIGNPDFNIKEFLSNLVFRWEYRPGSFLYLVWSQTRSTTDSYGYFNFENDFADIWDTPPRNVLMLKVSYRIGR